MPDDTFYIPDSYFHAEAMKAGKSVYELFPEQFRNPGHVLAVNSKAEAKDFAYRAGGRARRPSAHVALYGANGQPIMIAAYGVTEAAELEEMAIAVYEAEERKTRAGQPSTDFERLRAEAGQPSAASFDQRFKEGLKDWSKRVKRNHRTMSQGKEKKPKRLY